MTPITASRRASRCARRSNATFRLPASRLDGGAVRLLCMPRIFGYGFNPLSIYFCYRRDGALAALLYEVRNTFGERHSYLIPVRCRATVPLFGKAATSAFTCRHSWT